MPNLTFNVADLVGVDFDARRTKVWIEANADPIIDTAGRAVRFGEAKAVVADDGTGVFTGLLATNAAGINPSGFLYQVHVDYVRRSTGDRKVWPSGWFALTADSDLALVTPVAPSPPNTTDDAVIASRINDPASATKAALTASYAQMKSNARNPDKLIVGAVTRDANGAAISAAVVWDDGTPGTYTADTVSSAFPGAVDAYHITYGSPATKTFTQPLITRDATTGAATNVPAITVS